MSFDSYLEEQLKNPVFAANYYKARLETRELDLIAGQETLIKERDEALEALRSAENRLVSQRIATEAAIHAADIYRRDAELYRSAAKAWKRTAKKYRSDCKWNLKVCDHYFEQLRRLKADPWDL